MRAHASQTRDENGNDLISIEGVRDAVTGFGSTLKRTSAAIKASTELGVSKSSASKIKVMAVMDHVNHQNRFMVSLLRTSAETDSLFSAQLLVSIQQGSEFSPGLKSFSFEGSGDPAPVPGGAAAKSTGASAAGAVPSAISERAWDEFECEDVVMDVNFNVGGVESDSDVGSGSDGHGRALSAASEAPQVPSTATPAVWDRKEDDVVAKVDSFLRAYEGPESGKTAADVGPLFSGRRARTQSSPGAGSLRRFASCPDRRCAWPTTKCC